MFGTHFRSHSAASVIAVITLLSIFLCPPASHAQIPRTIAYNGILADAAGTPKANGNYTVTFRLFSVPTGGAALWTEADKTVTVFGGRGQFSTLLGSQTPFGALAFDKPYYLEVQVSGDPPMTPRMPLAAVPYALNAGGAGLTLPFTGAASVTLPGAVLEVTNHWDGYGLRGVADSSLPQSAGVFGEGWMTGGRFQGNSPNSTGLYGFGGIQGIYGDGGQIGVVGYSISGIGVHGESLTFEGVRGTSHHAGHGAVVGYNTADGIAVYGNSGGGAGVWGESQTGVAIVGESKTNGLGLGNHGIQGISRVASKAGVFGQNDQFGGWGVIGETNGQNSIGVIGNSNGFRGVGVKGIANNDAESVGVFGTSTGYGVYGEGRPGVYGISSRFGDYGGHFVGGVYIDGAGNQALYVKGATLLDGILATTGDKDFLIDHPLDPANKTLRHSCTEGPDALNIYNGNVTTDASGEVVVTLPVYFEALNRDFRYQLTCIGQFAQAIVAEEIRDNRFAIKTDKPHVKVSWQVTGVRNDAYMRTHSRHVEEVKPANQRGKYLDPESHGQPKEKGIGYLAISDKDAPA